MTGTRRWLRLISCVFGLSCSTKQNCPTPSDLVFRHGAIYTVNAARSWAEAIALNNGRIVYIGSDSTINEWIGARTKVVDLQGKMVLPGFHDSHVHPVSGGMELGECNLNGLSSQEQILAAIRQYAQQNPDAPWIRGGGWDLPIFPNGNPHKSLLDNIVADRPVILSAADGHSAWVNSKCWRVTRSTART
jgi:hypothetical protein